MPKLNNRVLIVLLLLFSCLSFCTVGWSKENVAASSKPNVLFIAVDDLRPELGCYGARALTPNLDRLAASGLQFDRAYCNQAVCGASRVSLMTGLYPEFPLALFQIDAEPIHCDASNRGYTARTGIYSVEMKVRGN